MVRGWGSIRYESGASRRQRSCSYDLSVGILNWTQEIKTFLIMHIYVQLYAFVWTVLIIWKEVIKVMVIQTLDCIDEDWGTATGPILV